MSAADDALDRVVAAVGGSRRDGQHAMATAVESALADGRDLLVQAGTGTGKSLAYVVPAILRAERGIGEHGENRTVIATATLALQRQLVDNDLPAAVAALGGKATFAVSKGRHNYVCLDKFNRDAKTAEDDDDNALIAKPSTALGRQAKKLRAWIGETSTGDRDDYPHELDARLWRSVAVSGRECVGAAKCVYGNDCFAEKARTEASKADIVVTNHALLVIDVIEGIPILPPHDAVVVDEAHELVDRTTNALAGVVDVDSVERAAKLVRKYVEPTTHDRLLQAGDALGRALLAIEGDNVRLESITGALHTSLTALRDICKVALDEIKSPSTDDPDVAAAKKRAKGDLGEVHKVAADLLTADERSVVWLSTERGPSLHHAPLSVADYLKNSLLDRSTVVMTSATLAVAGKMDATAAGLGLDLDAQGRTWSALDVGSPFDYGKQGILYCAAELPAPSQAGTADSALVELEQLIDAAGGRTLALFSSWRGVEKAALHLDKVFAGREDRPLIVAQRGDSVADLVRRFRDEPRASLLGTVSLWQGIDVPGESCTLVVIDRIPFPRPDDPVMSARSARVDATGGSGFASVSVPRAALLLAQGVGRLIRTTSDRGVVAILDSRLATKGYGSTLRKTLPPLWYTTDRDTVLSSLRNLDAAASANGK